MKWKYEDTSFTLNKNFKVKTGFFKYQGDELRNLLENAALNAIVKVRYESLDDDRCAVIFTPFVMLKSAKKQDIWNAFSTIYEAIAEKSGERKNSYIEHMEERRIAGDEKLSFNVNIFRAVIFFFSYYVGVLFQNWVKSFNIFLKMDESFMKENSGEEFIKAIGNLSNWMEEDYQEVIRKIVPWKAISESRFYLENDLYQQELETIEECLYEKIYMEIIERKRRNHLDGCFTIEDIEASMAKSFPMNLDECRNCITKNLLRMLDTSIIGNRIWYRDNVIYRGFRFGENSDIILPFFNTYLFFGVDLYYRKLGWHMEVKELIRQCFFSHIKELLDCIEKMLVENGYMGTIVSKRDVYFNKWYFEDNREDLAILIENKRFFLNGENTNGIIYREIARIVSEFELEQNIIE